MGWREMPKKGRTKDEIWRKPRLKKPRKKNKLVHDKWFTLLGLREVAGAGCLLKRPILIAEATFVKANC